MAIRGDASNEFLSQTSLIFNCNNFTIDFWVKIAVDLNAFTGIFITANAAGSRSKGLRTNSDGTTLRLFGEFASVNGSSLTVGTWYHIAIVSVPGNTTNVYLNGVLDITAGDLEADDTFTQAYLLSDASSFLNGTIYNIRLWNTGFTVDQVREEMYSVIPRNATNLVGWWPTFRGATDRAKDYSGNGRNFTENGTLSDEDGPGVDWGFEPYLLQLPGGATSHNLVADIVLASTTLDADVLALRNLLSNAVIASNTPDGDVLILRDILASASLTSSTPNLLLGILKDLLANIVITSDGTGTITVARSLLSAVGLTSTTDDSTLVILRTFLALVTLTSLTNDSSFNLLRALSGDVALTSTIPDLDLLVLRLLTTLVELAISTTDAELLIQGFIELIASVALSSSTSDSLLVIERLLNSSIALDSNTLATIRILRELGTSVEITSTTSNSVLDLVLVFLAVVSLTSTTDDALLSNLKGLTGNILLEGHTTSPTFLVLRSILSNVILTSGTVDVDLFLGELAKVAKVFIRLLAPNLMDRELQGDVRMKLKQGDIVIRSKYDG